MLSATNLKLHIYRTIFNRGQSVLPPIPRNKNTCILRVLNTSVRQQSTANEDVKKTIYIGEMTGPVKSIKLFSLVTSASGIIAQPFIIQQATEMGSTALLVAAYGFIGFFTFVTPVLLHLVTRKYCTDIVYNSKTKLYSACTISLFLRKKCVSFTPDDVKVPDGPTVFTTFFAKDIPLFVEPSAFKDVSHYGIIMGYDKPLDFKLGNDRNEFKK